MELPNHYTLSTGETVTDETWRDFVGSHPMLGAGDSRGVYALDEYAVLKVMLAHADPDIGDNESEAATWCAVSEHPDREFFAAVHAIGTGGAWLVMERAEDEGHRLPSDVEQYITVAWSVYDFHSGNVGIFPDGSVKVIDYAYPYDEDEM